ncbi:PepSY-associated TM helix domain-containing protein [Parahaliea mediterranea]|uniref:PepSY-associated TM helix domain-containing protein n=1 Tax=Parahaliea mediterranea TaxID=651086 RepID=UPI000E2F901D|nr:PepSY-associated TM helix domain-containing protein [Parahaliea mediterranea]
MDKGRISIWLGSVRQWHWISSALCLVGMLLFAVTGITLNHAGQIEASPQVRTLELALPAGLLQQLQQRDASAGDEARLPASLRQWLAGQSVHTGGRLAEWSEDEIYLPLPRPGGDAWLAIDLASGEVLYEDTDRGLISYLNDLHKGRNTGEAWRWFIDIFSVACLVFSGTGLWLLARHSASRPSTWPVVGLGLLIPLLLAILFVHR